MSDPSFPYSRGRHAPPQPGSPALRTERLAVRYPGTSQLVLQDVTVEAVASSRVALVGPNGAGKSTLLKTAAGLILQASGRIEIYGNRVGACHHRVAYLPQRSEIDWSFPTSLERLVLTGRYVHLGWFRGPSRSDWSVVREVMAELQLVELAERQISRLSGGQQQRALLARALAQEADLLLLDEPLNAVDAETREIIYEVIERLCRQGKTLVVATHDIGCLAEMFDAVIRLEAGRVVDADLGVVAWAH